MKEEFRKVRETARALLENMEKVIVGKRDKLELILIAFLCRGHVLINDVPGLGKTMMARAFAASIGGIFKRIQCTPDLLPSDIIGVSVFNPDTRKFAFRKGPVFSQILLVDEINRATPRTQSALLESMGENQVSIEGTSMPVPDPFFVIATQNPVEFEGTFPLPEAQMDRFFLSFDIGYPSPEEEVAIVDGQRITHPITALQAITDMETIAGLRQVMGEVYVEEDLKSYIVSLASATRTDPRLALGCSPRGSIFLFKAAQAYALLLDRDYVIPDDIKHLAAFVLPHRVIVKAEARLKGYTAPRILHEIIHGQEVPLEEGGGE